MTRDDLRGADRGIDSFFRKKREQAKGSGIEEAYVKALATLKDEGEIEPQTFEHYDRAAVQSDLAYVEKMKKVFEQQATPDQKDARKVALILEAIVHEQIELSDWFGSEVSTRKASTFDDIKNGVDSIVEFNRELGAQHLALALDVTYGDDQLKKLERIRREIDNEQLSTVKYFESSDGRFRGTLNQVPRVVIGTERTRVLALANLWLQKDKKQLAQHELQFELLEEINMQLAVFWAYAVRHGKTQVAAIFEQQQRLLSQIRESKKSSSVQQRDFTNDRVFDSLRKGLEIFT